MWFSFVLVSLGSPCFRCPMASVTEAINQILADQTAVPRRVPRTMVEMALAPDDYDLPFFRRLRAPVDQMQWSHAPPLILHRRAPTEASLLDFDDLEDHPPVVPVAKVPKMSIRAAPALEDVHELEVAIDAWVVLLEELQGCCGSWRSLRSLSSSERRAEIANLLSNKKAGTMQKHASAVRLFLKYLGEKGIAPEATSEAVVYDYLRSPDCA